MFIIRADPHYTFGRRPLKADPTHHSFNGKRTEERVSRQSPQATAFLRRARPTYDDDGGSSRRFVRRRQVPVSPGRRGREEHRVAARRAADVRRREQPLRVREDAGVAGGFAGGDGAERDQDVGDGAVAQGPPRGLQVGQPGEVHPVRQRRPRPHRGGDARHGQLQRAARRADPPCHRRVRRQGRDLRVLPRPLPLRLPARLRVGGRQGLLRPARDRLQVPALGTHGGALQGPRPHRRQDRVLRRRRPQGGRAAAGGGRGGVLRPRGASRGAHKGRQGGGSRRRSGGARREAQGSGYSVGVER